MVISIQPTLPQIWSFKVNRTTFLNYIKLVDPLILRLQNCEKSGRDIASNDRLPDRSLHNFKSLKIHHWRRFLNSIKIVGSLKLRNVWPGFPAFSFCQSGMIHVGPLKPDQIFTNLEHSSIVKNYEVQRLWSPDFEAWKFWKIRKGREDGLVYRKAVNLLKFKDRRGHQLPLLPVKDDRKSLKHMGLVFPAARGNNLNN